MNYEHALRNMQSPRKISSAIPEKPADFEEFVKKLERQSEHAHMTSPEAITIKRSTVVTSCGVKRPNDVPSTDSAPKKKHVVAPRIKPQSFYAKISGTYSPQKQLPLDAEVRSRGHATVATDVTGMRPAQGLEAIAMVSAAVENVHSVKSIQEGGVQDAVGTCGPRLPVIAAGTAPRMEFKLQRQAFEFFDQQKEPWSQHLRVFARELSGDGKRCFLVTTPAQLWVTDVESAKPGSCHLYEIIKEGMPCHLYFDLEFVPGFNPGVCGDSLVDLLVGLVAEELHGAFGIRMPLRQSFHQQQQQELREKFELWQNPEQPGEAGFGAAAAGGQQRQEQVLARESEDAGNEVEAHGVSGGGAASLGDGYAGASEFERGPCGDFPAAPGCGGDVNRRSVPDGSASISDGSCPWVWELCSTTAAKFSRHLIIRIPHCAFKDNFHVNAFVRRLFDRIAADPVRFGAFFVRRSADPDDPPALFIDPAVYTRNRAFRLYLSSKAGKAAVLRTTSRYAVASLLRRRGSMGQTGDVVPRANIPMQSRSCHCALSRKDLVAAGKAADATEDFCAQVANTSATAAVHLPDSTMSGGQASVLLPPSVEKEIARDIFLSSLVTGVGRVDRVLTMYDVGSGRSDGAASLAGFHAAADALLSSGPFQPMSCLGIPRLPRLAGGHGCAPVAAAGCKGPCLAAGAGPHPLRIAAAAPFQYGASPFPRLDEFIESVCCEGGVQGRVRCWQYLEDTATLLLSMRDNRWCANVGRAHRSNGIYFAVDLKGGTWHQRCFDPECRDFRSARMPLPPHLWEECRLRDDQRQHKDEENKAHQQHQQPGPRGAQPTDDGAQEFDQLQILQKRLQDQSRGRALVTAGTHGGSLYDEDDDPDFDMLCVQALERFERMVAANTAILEDKETSES